MVRRDRAVFHSSARRARPALGIGGLACFALLFEPADRDVDAAVKADIGGVVAAAVQAVDGLVAVARRALAIEVELALRVSVAGRRRHKLRGPGERAARA